MASPGGIVPARLGFLAIFNPTLGNTDETIDDQIVYYSSVSTQQHKRRHRSRARPTEHLSQDERNERLRQIGLAQGMVEFGKSFSGGRPVDTIDTDKSRVVLHELEAGWWILASIDLTRLPLPPKLSTGKSGETVEPIVEYSSKEIKPASLLLQDLLRAHSTFLLHHDASLSSLFVRSRRSKFLSVLGRYWDLFLSTWNVMLHGHPIRNTINGINIAASGELGIGVGEEERGSGERDVLEGLVGRVEGLVDLVVSKFGSQDTADADSQGQPHTKQQWLGTGQDPGIDDGAIFLGTGAMSRKSVKDVTQWMEDLYTWGENAYGVIDSPTSLRQHRRSKKASNQHGVSSPSGNHASVRPPLRTSESGSSSKSVRTLAERRGLSIGTVAEARTPEPRTPTESDTANGSGDEGPGNFDKLMGYMKMGYGTYWSIGKTGGPPAGDMGLGDGNPSSLPHAQRPQVDETAGHYLIGLMGEVEENSGGSSSEESLHLDLDNGGNNSRTMLRTLQVEVEEVGSRSISESDVKRDLRGFVNEITPLGAAPAVFGDQDRNKSKKLRVVVYVNKPFIFTFLFQLRTDSLAWDSLYKSLHYQLAPLKKPLLASTQFRLERPNVGPTSESIYDLVWDPEALTVHSTIPTIPDPSLPSNDAQPAWSRAEAINTHMQLLNIYNLTRSDVTDLERTCKTSRGWWVVWTRILDRPFTSQTTNSEGDDDDLEFSHRNTRSSSSASDTEGSQTVRARSECSPPLPTISKEIFLVRKASDHAGSRSRSGSYADTGGVWSDGSGRLTHGIGVDTRRYIENLLSLDR